MRSWSCRRRVRPGPADRRGTRRRCCQKERDHLAEIDGAVGHAVGVQGLAHFGERAALADDAVDRRRHRDADRPHPLNPRAEVAGRHGDSREALLLEALAIVLGVFAEEAAGGLRLEVKARHHAGHGVDLTAERGNEERLHHRVGRQLHRHRLVGWEGKLADAGDAERWIDEQPFPVVANDGDRQGLPRQRCVGIEVVRTAPEPGGHDRYDADRHAPGKDLERPGERPVRFVRARPVAIPVAPRQDRGQQDDRQHDDEKDQQDVDEIAALLRRHDPLRDEKADAAVGTAAERQHEREGRQTQRRLWRPPGKARPTMFAGRRRSGSFDHDPLRTRAPEEIRIATADNNAVCAICSSQGRICHYPRRHQPPPRCRSRPA